MQDLKEKIIKATLNIRNGIAAMHYPPRDHDADLVLDECLERINDLEEKLKQVTDGWISVKDQLPHDTQQVLIYVEKIGINSATYHEPYFGDVNKWLGWFSYEVPAPDVTHWQPIPDKPALSDKNV